MKKRAPAIFLCLALVLSFLCVPALADDQVAVAVNDHNQTFSSLEEAVTKTYDEWLEGTVTLLTNDILQNNLKIPENITVVIPTSADVVDPEKLKEGNGNVAGGIQAGSAYATLTVPTGLTLTVDKDATLIVAGNQQSTTPKAGFLTGNYGAIQLNGDLVVDGKLYARGEINGDGTLTANSGSTVYQRFQVLDWRGGTASLAAYSNSEHSVYPFELYQTGGVNVTAVYKNGSTMMGQSFIYSAQQTVGAISTVNVIGSSKSLLIFKESTDTNANITITHNKTTGVSTATIKGAVETGNISVDISIYGIHFPLTADGVGPFGYLQDIVVETGSTFSVSNEIKLLPGCTITVKPNATLNASGRLYAYTASAYSSTYNRAGWTSTEDAVIEVEDGGVLTGNIGSTSPTFGNIHGVTITANAPDEDVWEVTQSGTSVTFHSIPFTMHLTPAPTPDPAE